jgi:SAM-dependent methyltransferase
VNEHDSGREPFAYRTEERHALVEALLTAEGIERRGAGRRGVERAISGRDHSLHWALDHNHQHRGQALVTYFRSGLMGARVLHRLLEWRFEERAATARVLDFAAGYGRVARFAKPLVGELDAVEIDAGAVEFLQRVLEVPAYRSSSDPSTLVLDRRYDLVWAASLFSHLPERRFRAWLARLWAQVADGGLLVFSVLDTAVHPRPTRLGEEQFVFEPISEIDALALEEYGTTWTRPSFVEAAVDSACGSAPAWRRPRGLWHFQDLWVIAKGGDARSDPFATIASELDGALDTTLALGTSRVRLRGWAIDPGASRAAVTVRIVVDGEELAVVPANEPRDDVAAARGEAFRACGWQVELEARTYFPADAVLTIVAETTAMRSVLHLSMLEGADLVRRAGGALEEVRLESIALRTEIERLRQHIAWMETSRFWRLRNAWWRLRQRLTRRP